MSISVIVETLEKFLTDPTPSVFCIKGRWGTGKTFAVRETVKRVAISNKLKPEKFAYLSLFGLKDSSDILQSIFANTVERSIIIGAQTLPDRLGGQKFFDIYKKLRSLPAFVADHANVPFVASLGGVARALVSNLVTNTIVCLDDLERKSKTLSVNEIMGVVSQLRDERNCKIILILNENNLNVDEKNDFNRYAEKVINRELHFIPTPVEAASIAFPSDDQISSILKEACIDLRIVNVRVMTKIGGFARELDSLMASVDDTIRRNVLRSLVVLVWSNLSPVGEGAPTLEYLIEKRQRQFFGVRNQEFSNEEIDQEFSNEEIGWGALLNEYGFTGCDEFELLMIEGIRNGYFDKKKVKSEIEKSLRNLESSRANAAIEAAWRPFHESFDNNAEDVAKSIFESFSKHVKYLSPFHLDSAVSILKEIGEPEMWKELLNTYLVVHNKDNNFDRTRHLFGPNMTDPDVIAALEERAKQFPAKLPSPFEAAHNIYNGSWSPDDEAVLATLSVHDLVALFSETREPNRSVLILACLEFRKFNPATSQQSAIVANATEALICLGKQSPLNARRLRAFGVSLPPSENGE